MDGVVKFYSKQPKGLFVNGEQVDDAEIEASMPEFSYAEDPRDAASRALLIRTLLRQRARALEIEADNEEAAIEKLIGRELAVPPVFDEEIQRYFDANRQKFRSGDLFEVRHILFNTTVPETSTETLRKAEAVLLQVKAAPESFKQTAETESVCPSAKLGGTLGQISEGGVVSEFWAALVAFGKAGLMPHLVSTRYGHHIVLVERCAVGEVLPFEAVESRIRDSLTARLERTSYQQYISKLIEAATITGIELGDTSQPPPGPGLPAA